MWFTRDPAHRVLPSDPRAVQRDAIHPSVETKKKKIGFDPTMTQQWKKNCKKRQTIDQRLTKNLTNHWALVGQNMTKRWPTHDQNWSKRVQHLTNILPKKTHNKIYIIILFYFTFYHIICNPIIVISIIRSRIGLKSMIVF
jgi:hypothetical protein